MSLISLHLARQETGTDLFTSYANARQQGNTLGARWCKRELKSGEDWTRLAICQSPGDRSVLPIAGLSTLTTADCWLAELSISMEMSW
jgi:hypothetical protein